MAKDWNGREYGSFHIKVGGGGSGDIGWSTKDEMSFSSLAQAKDYAKDKYDSRWSGRWRVMEVKLHNDTIAYNNNP